MSTAVLTIDDISSANTPAMVDCLLERNICAVMFAVGQNVQKYYDEAVYAVKKGMIVGNHSWSHVSFGGLPFDECVSEIEKTEALLDRIYSDAGVPRLYKPFRFPYGDRGEGAHFDALQAYLKKSGFSKLKDGEIALPWWKRDGMHRDRDTFWTFDFLEYCMYMDKDFTLQSVFDRIHDKNPCQGGVLLEEGSSHIVLMHAHDETETVEPEYCKKILDRCLENGVTFIRPEFV